MQQVYIVTLIGIVPGVLALLIPWLISQRGVSRRAKELNTLLRRIELVEKLRQEQEQTSDSKARYVKILEKEVADILDDLESTQEILVPSITTPPHKVARWRLFLVLYKLPSLKSKIYRGLFFACLFIVASGSISLFTDEIQGVYMIGLAFYAAVGLGFRAAAVRDYKRIMKKAEAAKTSGY